MKSLAVFNNKGGVGKTTLSFHLAHALSEMGKKVLVIDLDPQCNFSIFALSESEIDNIWNSEEGFIDGFKRGRDTVGEEAYQKLISQTRSIHFLLKPAEEGVDDLDELPPPYKLSENLAFIPGRLSLHMYEDKISSRWSDVFVGDDLALRTVSNIRTIAERYASERGIDIVIYDTSPSLGILNRVVLSMADGFIIPCNPDLFSLYGVRNIGRSLDSWSSNFSILSQVLPKSRRSNFPENPVRFLGYTIYKATKYANQNDWDLATGHYNYAQQIPQTISDYIGESIRANIGRKAINEPIGGTAVMHSHQTMATMAQKYKVPMWQVPSADLDSNDKSSVSGNRNRYQATRDSYFTFSEDLLARMEAL